MRIAYRRFLVVLVSSSVMLVAVVAALTRYADPYWLSDGRANRADSPALDTQMRLSKSLQIMVREQETPLKVVFVGSSTVYRGLNPSVLDYPEGAVYNLGISSLRMREAKAYVQHLLLFSRPETVLIGLDFFQFDGRNQAEAGFEPALGSYATAIEMYLRSIASRDALQNSIRVLKSSPDPDGAWSRDGYKKTSPRSAAAVNAQLDSATTFYRKVDSTSPAPYGYLEDIILMLKERDIAVKLYLSPVHAKYEAVIRSAGKGPEYADWKQHVRNMATSHGLTLLEIDVANGFTAPVFDGDSGFNDPTHFSEWVGTMIMRRIGLPVKASPQPANWK